jgi:rhodanese-related sulfurtransferase
MKNLVLFFLIFTYIGSYSQTTTKNVDAQTFKKYVDEKKGVLIDLRTNEEIEKKGMIKGAVQIDYFSKNAESEIAKLDRKKTYLIYCAGGGRSSECAELMEKHGFKEVINLEKGFDAWKKSGYEVQMKTSSAH